MFSRRSLGSLTQYFGLQDRTWTEVIFKKHGIDVSPYYDNRFTEFSYLALIDAWLSAAGPQQVESLASEVIRTQGSFRNKVSPRYIYDERWEDLRLCFQLDGYVIDENQLRTTEPSIDGTISAEDDLALELRKSSLSDAEDVISQLSKSADDFRFSPPDLNGALTNARVALQTLATAISRARSSSRPSGLDESKWGQIVAHLRTSGTITDKEESGLSGVFTFVSPGAHIHVGLSETEMVRLGRSLVIGMCYFLIKRFNG